MPYSFAWYAQDLDLQYSACDLNRSEIDEQEPRKLILFARTCASLKQLARVGPDSAYKIVPALGSRARAESARTGLGCKGREEPGSS